MGRRTAILVTAGVLALATGGGAAYAASSPPLTLTPSVSPTMPAPTTAAPTPAHAVAGSPQFTG